ncbi:MFS-type transporter [Paramyrothecium foliicola]|nr:MFS-type transporter [Paramyrothecium foliicola]
MRPYSTNIDNFEVTPGTVHLVDAQGSMRAQHGLGGEQDIVLIPAPSQSPDDPLNWSRRRKFLSAFCMALYVLVIGICSSALYSTLGPLSEATGLTYNDLNSGTGYMGVMIWQPHIRTNGEWIAAKILQGIFGAPMESLAEITVSDVFFTHERGKYMALYALALGYSNGISPLMMAFINEGQGYQWVFVSILLLKTFKRSNSRPSQYWCAIFCGVTFVVVFFFMEETKFDRNAYTHSLLLQYRGNSTQSNDAKPPDIEATGSEEETKKGKDESLSQIPSVITGTHVQLSPTNDGKKSYISRLKPVECKNLRAESHLIKLMLRPFLLFQFPIIVYAGFLYGSNIVWLSVLNATESMVLSSPPYSMSKSAVGLTFIAPLIGTTLASIYTGIYGDRFIMKMARKNNGYMEAEHRLWLFIPSLLLVPFGCILFGVGAYHHIHWFGITFAMGVISFTTTAGSQMSIAYTVDCYRDLGSEALATVMIIRNTMSFGIGYGVTPWVTNMGFQNAFILGAFAGLAHNMTIFPIIRWGRFLRDQSAAKYWRFVKDGEGLDTNH